MLRDYAVVESLIAGVDPTTVTAILSGESKFNINVKDGDMNLTCPRGIYKGKPVRAKGPAQITDCYHPEVSETEAHDPIFAINFVINQVDKGKCQQEFSTCPLSRK